jgi:type II secretory pathway component GspD/PulD (secretin)
VSAQLYCGTETNGIDLSCLPFVTVDGTNGAVDLAVRVNTKGWFTDYPAGDWPTFVGTNSYAISARAWAEDHGGMVLRVENPSRSEVNNLVVVLGVQIVTNNPSPVKTSERLEAIVDRAHKDTAADLGKTRTVPETSRNASPQVFSGITNKPASSADVSTNLDTRTFMVNLNSGLANLRKKTGLAESSTSDEYLRGFSKLLATSGTTLPPTSIWLKENGLLLVRGTPQELDAVEQTVRELNGYLPKEISDKTNVDANISSGNPVQDAKLDYEMGKFDEAENLLTSVLTREPKNQTAHYYLNLVKQARYDQESQRYTNDMQARMVPVNRGLPPMTNFVRTGTGREVIYSKLNRIRFDKVSWPDGLPLSEALRNLSDQTKLRDPDKKGINFTFHPNAPAASAATAPAGGESVDASSINVKLKLTNMRLADLLDAIVLAADHPIKYSILDDGIVFSTKDSNSPPLETRTFKVDANVFLAALQKQTGLQTNVSVAMRQLLSNVGLDLSPPKTIFFNDRLGVLLVHATEQDLDTIEKAIQALITPPSQIHIKARFIEVPEDLAKYQLGTNLIPAGVTSAAGILTDPNFRLVLHTLEQSKGTETLAEPEVTTVSDRQTQMRATEIISVINGINPQARRSPGVSATNVMQIMQIETGPVLDVIPHLMGDGCTLDLNVTAGVTEFTGYDEQGKTNITTVYVDGRKQQVNIPIPQITTRELKTNLRVRDGQTILLGGVSHETLVQHQEQVPGAGSRPTGESRFREQTTRIIKKQLLVLITATLVDPAGNRIHGDDEMSPARTGIPPQDSP